MKPIPRRSFLSRVLALVGISTVPAISAPASSPWHGEGFYPPIPHPITGPWEVLRWNLCLHEDGYGASLVLEVRSAYHRESRLLVSECRHGEGWKHGSYGEVIKKHLRPRCLKMLDDLNAAESMALHA